MDTETADTARNIVMAIALGLLVIVVLVYGSIALYRGSWDLATANVKRAGALARVQASQSNSVIQNQYNVQQGYQQAITNYVSQIDILVTGMAQNPAPGAARAQMIRLGDDACAEAIKLTRSVPVPPAMQTWIKQNCDGLGNLRPSSPIYTGKGN
jgi:hypothetical protein